jgi:hypothetical protein
MTGIKILLLVAVVVVVVVVLVVVFAIELSLGGSSPYTTNKQE